MKKLIFTLLTTFIATPLLANATSNADIASICAKYLTGKQVVAGVETTSADLSKRKIDVPVEIHWNILAYSKLGNPSAIQSLGGTDVSSLQVFAEFNKQGYTFLLLKEPICPQCLSKLAIEAQGFVSVPVFINKKSVKLLTRLTTVLFKPEVSKAEIDALNASIGALIQTELKIAPNLYEIRVENTSEISSIELSHIYKNSGLVEFAEPQFLEVWIHR